MDLPHPLQLNIQVRKLHRMIQHFMILQLGHTSLITQSLKEIRGGRETGLIDTGRLFVQFAYYFSVVCWFLTNRFNTKKKIKCLFLMAWNLWLQFVSIIKSRLFRDYMTRQRVIFQEWDSCDAVEWLKLWKYSYTIAFGKPLVIITTLPAVRTSFLKRMQTLHQKMMFA